MLNQQIPSKTWSVLSRRLVSNRKNDRKWTLLTGKLIILVLEWGENQKDLDDAKTNLKEVETKLLEYEFILETFKQSVFRTSVIFISLIINIKRG